MEWLMSKEAVSRKPTSKRENNINLNLNKQGAGLDSCGLVVGICEDRNEILFLPYTIRAQLLSDFRLPPPCT